MSEIKIKKLSDREVEEMGIKNWGIWEKEVSEFDWAYTDEEHCYIIDGEAEIVTDDGKVEIKKGDYVIFPRGLKCRWKVKAPFKKYYSFK